VRRSVRVLWPAAIALVFLLPYRLITSAGFEVLVLLLPLLIGIANPRKRQLAETLLVWIAVSGGLTVLSSATDVGDDADLGGAAFFGTPLVLVSALIGLLAGTGLRRLRALRASPVAAGSEPPAARIR